jgi:hypothetical protein
MPLGFIGEENALQSAPTLDQINDQNDDGDHEQDMNEPAHGIRADESEQPENEQNNKDGPEHIDSFG